MFFFFEFFGRLIAVQLMAREEAGRKLTKKAIIEKLSPSLKEDLLKLAPDGVGLKDLIKINFEPGLLNVREILNCRFCEAARFNELARQFGPALTVRILTIRITVWLDNEKVKNAQGLPALALKIMEELNFLKNLSVEGEMTELKFSCPHFGAAD